MTERLLLICDSYPPEFGGVARHVHTLSHFLANEKYDVTVLTPPTDKKELDESNNLKIMKSLEYKKKTSPLQWPYLLIENSRTLRDTIDKIGRNFDCIHYHGTNTLFLHKVKTSTPLTMTLHGIFPACIFFQEIDTWCGKKPSSLRCSLCVAGIRNQYYPLLPGMIPYSSYYYTNMNKSLKKFNIIISVSDYVKNIVERAFNLNNIVTLYNFIDIKRDIIYNLNKYGNNLNIRTCDEKIILYSGGLKYSKGIGTLIETYRMLDNDERIKLVISGIGPYEEKIRSLAHKDKNVIYLGYLSRPDQMKVLNETDVFLAPSIYPDACPTAILEAMALGKPVISTKVGGIPELVEDGKTGHLVDPNDPRQIKEKLLTVFSKGPQSYADGCRERAKLFDISSIGPQIIKLYKTLR